MVISNVKKYLCGKFDGLVSISSLIRKAEWIMKKYDYLIVGAGPFGSIFAREAKKMNKSCLVIDKRNHIAGNMYTESIEGINVHKYGAHIFHTSNEKVWAYVNQFAEFNNFINAPLAKSRGKLYNLPFNMSTFNQLWGVQTPDEAKAIINKQVNDAGITRPQNLEEQALKLVGKDVYETLIKEYTEKQWGMDCTELPAFIIRRLPVRYIYDNNYFNDKYQGIPVGGYTQIIEQLLDGIDVELNTEYKDIVNNPAYQFDKVLYTGPIDEFYDYKFGALEYRSLAFETKIMDTDNFQGNAVINYIDRDISYTRIIEHKHFEFGKQERTVVTYEHPQNWTPGMEPYYPVNNKENEERYNQYKAHAENDSNVIFGGRLGSYRYLNMDQVVELALKLVEKELG